MSTFQLKQGNRVPSLERTLRWSDATAVNLTGCTVMLKMVSAAGRVLAHRACTIVDASAGRVRFDWAAGETDVAGQHKAEFLITYPDGRPLTVPNRGQMQVIIEAAL